MGGDGLVRAGNGCEKRSTDDRRTEKSEREKRTADDRRTEKSEREKRTAEDKPRQARVPTHRLFSRLLLKSLIMSERNSRLTSISSALGVEFFSSVATTLRITADTPNTHTHCLLTFFSFPHHHRSDQCLHAVLNVV